MTFLLSSPHCGHWLAESGRHCQVDAGVRLYLVGWRCPLHTPARLAGEPEPPSPTPITRRSTTR